MKESIFYFCLNFLIHNSELYKKIGVINTSKILSLIFTWIFLGVKHFFPPKSLTCRKFSSQTFYISVPVTFVFIDLKATYELHSYGGEQ